MGFIERELRRLEAALREPQTDARYCQLYAAQQALSWALDPDGYASPYAVVQTGSVMPLTGTPEGSEGCLAAPRHSLSSDTCSRIC